MVDGDLAPRQLRVALKEVVSNVGLDRFHQGSSWRTSSKCSSRGKALSRISDVQRAWSPRAYSDLAVPRKTIDRRFKFDALSTIFAQHLIQE